MHIVKALDKRTGHTYVYEAVSYWDKEKKQPRSRRKLIGKIDPETGEIVPTNGMKRKAVEETSSTNSSVNSPDYTALYNSLVSENKKTADKLVQQSTMIAKLSLQVKQYDEGIRQIVKILKTMSPQ